MEEHFLYWPSKLFAHFGNRCQWGEVLESFVEKFRDSSFLSLVVFQAFASLTQALLVVALHGDA